MQSSIAFVFPGQGSQSLQMMLGLSEHFPLVRDVFDEASTVLGYDLWHLVQEGPEEKLNQTEFTQPALLAAGTAAWQVYLSESGKMPAYLAGHSLGEYTALVAAGAIEFTEAVRLVAKRGAFMQAAVPAGVGAMAAIVGLADADVMQVCVQASQGELVAPANYNSIGQVVVAGQQAAVVRAVHEAEARGAKLAKILPVSVPSHCALMQPAAEQLRACLELIDIREPVIPVVNNVDVAVYASPEQIRSGLERQLTHCVRWVEIIEFFVAHGMSRIVECGPGKVLTGLNKRINKSLLLTAYSDPVSLADVLTYQ